MNGTRRKKSSKKTRRQKRKGGIRVKPARVGSLVESVQAQLVGPGKSQPKGGQ